MRRSQRVPSWSIPVPNLAPKPLAELIEAERVTLAAGVPTIWMGVLGELEGRDVSSLRAIPCGGSAVPKALSEGYREVTVGLPIPAGMGHDRDQSAVLSSPISARASKHLDDDARRPIVRTTVGTVLPTVEFRICEPDTVNEIPTTARRPANCRCGGPM